MQPPSFIASIRHHCRPLGITLVQQVGAQLFIDPFDCFYLVHGYFIETRWMHCIQRHQDKANAGYPCVFDTPQIKKPIVYGLVAFLIIARIQWQAQGENLDDDQVHASIYMRFSQRGMRDRNMLRIRQTARYITLPNRKSGYYFQTHGTPCVSCNRTMRKRFAAATGDSPAGP